MNGAVRPTERVAGSVTGWRIGRSARIVCLFIGALLAATAQAAPPPQLASVYASVVPLDAVHDAGIDGPGGSDPVSAQVPDPEGSPVSAQVPGAEGSPVSPPDTGAVRKFVDEPTPIASITKLMTALVVLRSGLPLDEWLTVPERQQEPPNNAWSRIRVGSEATREDLLRITLMASENYAAYVLARHHPGGTDAFVAEMNRLAEQLGMHDTRFRDPAGLWVENVSTASDLVRLVQAAHAHPEIREMSTTTWHRAHFRAPRYHLDFGNTNPLLHNERWTISLSKTGYLEESGRCLVMVAVLDGKSTVLVLLDSFGQRSPIGDAGRIRRWIESGTPGTVAGPAAEYERERVSELLNGGGVYGHP